MRKLVDCPKCGKPATLRESKTVCGHCGYGNETLFTFQAEIPKGKIKVAPPKPTPLFDPPVQKVKQLKLF